MPSSRREKPRKTAWTQSSSPGTRNPPCRWLQPIALCLSLAIGKVLGLIYGKELSKSEYYKDIDLVIPVPLHPKKLKKRGYNQSDYFAMGLAKGLNASWLPNGLSRTADSQSQTLRSRFDRWQNMNSAFGMRNPQKFDGLNVLIVDDVITTGSTLEACAEVLLLIPNVKVSVAAIACA